MQKINLYNSCGLDVQVSIPEKWDEFCKEEVEYVSGILFGDAELDVDSAKASILLSIIEIRAKQQKIKLPKSWQRIINVEGFWLNGINLFDFVLKNCTLKRNHFKTLQFGITKLIAPADRFENITCGEFEDCEKYFFEQIQDSDLVPVSQIISILYRPKNTPYQTLDRNGKLRTYNTKRWLKNIFKLPKSTQFGIYMWYVGCRNSLPFAFPTLYGGGGGGGSSSNDIMIFTKIVHAAAGEKNGNREHVRMTNLLELLFDLEQEAIASEKLKNM